MAAHILLQLLKLLRDGKICLGALQLGFTPSWALGVGCTLTSAPDLFWSARSPSSSLNPEYNHLVDLKSSIYKYLANKYILSTVADYIFQRWSWPCHLSHKLLQCDLVTPHQEVEFMSPRRGPLGWAGPMEYGEQASTWLLKLNIKVTTSHKREKLSLLEPSHHVRRKPKPHEEVRDRCSS